MKKRVIVFKEKMKMSLNHICSFVLREFSFFSELSFLITFILTFALFSTMFYYGNIKRVQQTNELATYSKDILNEDAILPISQNFISDYSVTHNSDGSATINYFEKNIYFDLLPKYVTSYNISLDENNNKIIKFYVNNNCNEVYTFSSADDNNYIKIVPYTIQCLVLSMVLSILVSIFIKLFKK